jgi:transketolase
LADIDNEKSELKELRKKIFIAGYKGGMAHLASCYSALEIIYTLYLKRVLHYDSSNPKWEDRDRFVLSKGHAGLALYSVLTKAGLMTDQQYWSYLREDSRIGGEPCMRDSQWVEAATGSLGHGLSMAMGMALGLKLNHSSAKVYCLLGDGECEEGTVWEAAITAAAFKLDNLTVILDCNEIQKMDHIENIIGRPDWNAKWKAFGWNVVETDGHDTEEIRRVLTSSAADNVPTFIIAHTVKGKGISIMENNPNWHFRLPGRKELKIFKQELEIKDSELE